MVTDSGFRDNQARVEAIFLQALAPAEKQGELSPKEELAALARFFVVTIQGMRAGQAQVRQEIVATGRSSRTRRIQIVEYRVTLKKKD